ncbi:helix-turn-helix domain-containing protein, partial [Psychrobacter sanguinis]
MLKAYKYRIYPNYE